MERLTETEIKALAVLKGKAGKKFRAVSFSGDSGVEVPPSWFKATFSPEDSEVSTFISRDGTLRHVTSNAYGLYFETIMGRHEYEGWVRGWQDETLCETDRP